MTAVRKDSIEKMEAVGLSKAVATVIVAVIVAIATVIVTMKASKTATSKTSKTSKKPKAPKAPKAERNILSTVLRTGEEKRMSLEGFRKSAAWTAEAEAALLDGQTVSTPYKSYRLVETEEAKS